MLSQMDIHIELIPERAWGKNVRSKVKKSDWDKIRKAVYAKENMECHICREKCKSLDAHEVWEFDEINHIQKLVEIIGICKACHNTIHYGRACKLGTHNEARDNFLKVNECDLLDWELEIQQAQIDALRRRNIPDWKLDISLIEAQGYEIIEQDLIEEEGLRGEGFRDEKVPTRSNSSSSTIAMIKCSHCGLEYGTPIEEVEKYPCSQCGNKIRGKDILYRIFDKEEKQKCPICGGLAEEIYESDSYIDYYCSECKKRFRYNKLRDKYEGFPM
jgi:DNA-directed RNA polymerase subunit RPC12/RpoP